MRSHLNILEDIISIFSKNGLEEEQEQLDNEMKASFTGSELCLRSASKLLTLESSNKDVKILAGHLINELVKYCKANGLYPKPNFD